uniref:PX domain-containing protein n=1 Tax=Ditylenchus dipsaci TaxID=166011 RepID=A0A915D9Y3_9BILA
MWVSQLFFFSFCPSPLLEWHFLLLIQLVAVNSGCVLVSTSLSSSTFVLYLVQYLVSSRSNPSYQLIEIWQACSFREVVMLIRGRSGLTLSACPIGHAPEARSSIGEEQKLGTGVNSLSNQHSSPSKANANGRRKRSQSRTTSDSRTDLSVEEEDNEDATTITDDIQSIAEVGKKGGSGSGREESTERVLSSPSNSKEYSASHGAQRDVARSRSTGPDTASMAGKQMGTSKMKTINRFSNFVKTGMESYILAATKINSERTEKHAILLKDNNHIEWLHPKEIYTCVVSKPKKESKLKGLKSFIAYSLTSSLSGIQVSRRYKHFDWLHEQLASKYLLIPIPPLPEKQVSGRYEEDLIEHRKSILQVWVNKICRHPVLSQSNVWKHFMTCTDANNWKKGKRAAEKDEYVGGNFFHCIEVPEQPVDSRQIEKQIDGYAKCVRSMDESTRELFERITDNQKRLIGPYKSNWQKMAAAFDSLGKSLDLDSSQPNSPVKNAIRTSAHTLHKIGNQHEEHGKKDMEQLLDYLYIYKGLFTNIPDIVNVHRSALSKIRDNDRLQAEGKLAPQDADAIHHRVDVTTYSMMAEISHFNQERDADFRHMFGDFFAQQAAFYSSIGEQMAQLAALYKN